MQVGPIAYLITWSTYGSRLQGDERGWRIRVHGSERKSQPRLKAWHRGRLRHEVRTLTKSERAQVEAEIARVCEWRGWKHWACSARTNHVHTVVTAPGQDGVKVREQLKANCTRVLRETSHTYRNRPVWSKHGDIQYLDTEADLEAAILYVTHAQDRKHLDPS